MYDSPETCCVLITSETFWGASFGIADGGIADGGIADGGIAKAAF